MKHRVAVLPLVLISGILFTGCEPTTPVATSTPPGPPPPPGTPPAAAPVAPPTTATPAPAPLPPETKFGVFAGDVNDLAARPEQPVAPPAPTAPADAADPNTERVKAEKGVGIKGRSLDQYEGLVVTPAKAFFSTKERIAFEVQIPHSLDLYKASEGQAPKTHEEFMEKIVEFNRIKLPQLPPGHKYVYDPQTEQLMVERPKKQ